ncbi:MAG: hypothetical protein M3Y21_07900, partial [Candidatus Eremiobacteraeota bacterium]|nr:hypothetical protein [Candidatus Eremiobacteraeota bacterium]
LEIALALGAPLIAAPLASETAASRSQVLSQVGIASSLAKRANVTLALRDCAGSFAADAHDFKRISKDADSAWLRFGPSVRLLSSTDDSAPILPKTVLIWDEPPYSATDLPARLGEFRGFVALDDPSRTATSAGMKNALRAMRGALIGTDRT